MNRKEERLQRLKIGTWDIKTLIGKEEEVIQEMIENKMQHTYLSQCYTLTTFISCLSMMHPKTYQLF